MVVLRVLLLGVVVVVPWVVNSVLVLKAAVSHHVHRRIAPLNGCVIVRVPDWLPIVPGWPTVIARGVLVLVVAGVTGCLSSYLRLCIVLLVRNGLASGFSLVLEVVEVVLRGYVGSLVDIFSTGSDGGRARLLAHSTEIVVIGRLLLLR